MTGQETLQFGHPHYCNGQRLIPGVHFQTASCALVGEDTQRTGDEAARLQASDGIGSDTRADFQRSLVATV